MSIDSGFFTSVNGDRKYTSDDFAAYFGELVGNGVLASPSTNMQVISDDGMNVTVQAGSAWIRGRHKKNTGNYTLSIDVADGVLNRIDRIVCRQDLAAREIRLEVVKGTPASSAAAPALVRDGTVYDLGLALVSVAAGATEITPVMIADTRQDSAVCGIVTGLIDQIDVTDLFVQYGSAFTNWFDEIKGQLSTDAAGNLQNQINGIRKVALVGTDATDFSGWYKVAEQTCSGYGNTNITFAVTSTYATALSTTNNRSRGVLELSIRSDVASVTCPTLCWSTRIGFNPSDFVVVVNDMKWTLYVKSINRNGRICFEMLSYSGIYSKNFIWPLTFQDNSVKEATDPVATVISSDGDFFNHSLSDTVHALTGILPTSGTCELTFKASAGYTYGDTFTLNNTAYTATKANGTVLNTDDFIAGAIVSVNVDVTSKKLFFKLGGISAGMYANHQFFAANGTFTVPKTGKYHIVCAGAGGNGGSGDNGTDDYGDHWWAMGGSGGSGAVAIKDVVLTAGQTVNITGGTNSSASFGSYCTGGKGGYGGSGGYGTNSPVGGSAGVAGSASGGDTNYPGWAGTAGDANWDNNGSPHFIYGAMPTATTELTSSTTRCQFGSWDTFGVMPSGFPMCSEGAGADSTDGSPWNYYRGAIGGVLIEWN